ncbi:hypothetical protein SEUBUCD646_0M04630 [Saccharomyces eubayanus]|uniref:Secreted protein n=1 Tax=Saccharomyces eubayanus TaxID=1080349 RepID=A0ABN8VL29_SACEU|nr:hypothetical protein SEUBUCD650_0M04570 [Saccharomyces eubayanus]CAI1690138.1 hypothetical protein SEUBUCD646_0M04630 [Saccharomyces eubayanus]
MNLLYHLWRSGISRTSSFLFSLLVVSREMCLGNKKAYQITLAKRCFLVSGGFICPTVSQSVHF